VRHVYAPFRLFGSTWTAALAPAEVAALVSDGPVVRRGVVRLDGRWFPSVSFSCRFRYSCRFASGAGCMFGFGCRFNFSIDYWLVCSWRFSFSCGIHVDFGLGLSVPLGIHMRYGLLNFEMSIAGLRLPSHSALTCSLVIDTGDCGGGWDMPVAAFRWNLIFRLMQLDHAVLAVSCDYRAWRGRYRQNCRTRVRRDAVTSSLSRRLFR